MVVTQALIPSLETIVQFILQSTYVHVVNLIKIGEEIVGEGSDPPRPSELIYLMLEVLFKRIFFCDLFAGLMH